MSTDSTKSQQSLLAVINLKLLVFTLLMFPVLLSLGFWQLSREAEKKLLLETMDARSRQLPANLEEITRLDAEDLAFLPLAVDGHYDNEKTFLLDNRTYEGRSGVEVISPFITTNGKTLLVNRGWAPRGAYRTELPEIPVITGEVSLLGQVYVQTEKPFMLGEESPFSGWPRILQALDTGRMFSELDTEPSGQALSHTLRLQAGVPGVLEPYWQPVNMMPAKHRGYAVQWFTMAAVLVILYLYSLRSIFRKRKHDG